MEDESTESALAKDRRLVSRLLQYCRTIADEAGVVRLNDINPDQFSDFKAECFVLDISGSQDSPRFHTVGAAFQDSDGQDFTGKNVAEVPQDCLLFHAAGYVSRVLKKPAPLSLGGQFRQGDGRIMIYRSVLVPLRDQNNNITHMIGAANCREMALS